MEIKILQWNVWYKEKPEHIARVLNEIDADIVCLQEVSEVMPGAPGVNVMESLAGAFPHPGKFFLAQTWTNGGVVTRNLGNAIFSKFGFAGEKTFFIQDSGSGFPEADDEGRVYAETDIILNETTKLSVATTHMSYTHAFEGSEKRDEENRQLLKCFSKDRKHFIFCGDLNATPQSPFIQTFEQKTGLIPALFFAEPTWTTKPFEYNGFKADTLDYRLDYVFTSIDINVISSEIIQTDVSDHLPILTTIKV